jgi:prostaglandin-H2 D-isomerase / glutathione transferase
MTRYKLTYFDIDGGRAEPIRIAFHAAGIDFEDERIAFADFGEYRKGARFKMVPVLEIDGVAVTQSNAIGRYIGRMAGLYPAKELQALYCDEVTGVVEDLTHHIVPTFSLQGEEQKLAREALVEGWMTTTLRGLDELLTRGGGLYFVDNRLTMADLKVFVQTNWLHSGQLDHVPVDLVMRVAPRLVEHKERVASDERVVAYYASRAAA